MKNAGLLILFNVAIVAAYCFLATNLSGKRILGFSLLGIFVGAVLILNDRLTLIRIKGIGEIQAAQSRAIAGAERIEAIQKEVEDQRASIAMVVRDADTAHNDIERINQYVASAETKTKQLEGMVKGANEATSQLSKVTEFNLLLTRANNDDRPAFDQLIAIANSSQPPYSSLALSGLINLATSLDTVLRFAVTEEALEKWQPPFHAKTATLEEYRAAIDSQRPDVASGILDVLWQQERFSKYQKLDLVMRVMATTKSIKVLREACVLADNEAQIQRNILGYGQYLEWWAKNRDHYRSQQPNVPAR